MIDLDALSTILNIKFEDESLLKTAFCHSSYAYNHHLVSNERLEFLGDSLLNFVVTDFLYRTFEKSEGELSKLKAYLVSAENLSSIIASLGVSKYLLCENFNPNNSKNVLCDLFEAILGAIYLDKGFETARKFIYTNLDLTKQNILDVSHNAVDYKTKLQEFVQQSGKNTIEYILIGKSGKSHDPEFEIELKIDGNVIASASAHSKKLAENLCAKIACEKYGV